MLSLHRLTGRRRTPSMLLKPEAKVTDTISLLCNASREFHVHYLVSRTQNLPNLEPEAGFSYANPHLSSFYADNLVPKGRATHPLLDDKPLQSFHRSSTLFLKQQDHILAFPLQSLLSQAGIMIDPLLNGHPLFRARELSALVQEFVNPVFLAVVILAGRKYIV